MPLNRRLYLSSALLVLLTMSTIVDDDEDELEGSENNNSPGHAVLPVDDQVDVSIAWTMLSPFVESDEDDDDDDASPTAPGLVADGSNATTASTIALDRSVDGSDTPPASPTALGLPADGSDLPEEGDATDAGSIGNEVGQAGDGATAASSIPPVQQSTFYPFFGEEMRELGSHW
jgi:hypothetical protein